MVVPQRGRRAGIAAVTAIVIGGGGVAVGAGGNTHRIHGQVTGWGHPCGPGRLRRRGPPVAALGGSDPHPW
jgi:hypothetical protein